MNAFDVIDGTEKSIVKYLCLLFKWHENLTFNYKARKSVRTVTKLVTALKASRVSVLYCCLIF